MSDRLTKTSNKGGTALNFEVDITDNNGCMKNLVEVFKKLKHYEDLEEQGKLVKLPYKVGDKVVITFNYFGEVFIQEGWIVQELTITDEDIIGEFYCNVTEESEERSFIRDRDTIFSTRDEAETKLKELEADSK